MNASIAKNETLLAAALTPFDVVRQVGLVIGFSLLTALSAQIAIPIGPVPITGQTFGVLLVAGALGEVARDDRSVCARDVSHVGNCEIAGPPLRLPLKRAGRCGGRRSNGSPV